MNLDFDRTIVALSSGVAAGRRAIVRMSGARTREILECLTQTQLGHIAAASFRSTVCIGWQNRKVPLRIYYWPNHRSFTGEPCAELHLLGSMPLVESLTEHIISLGASPARRGEFTLRSFLAEKIDLTQAEAVLGVIEADSPTQLSKALQQLGGNLSKPVRDLRDQLLELTAHLEAGLDFVEEDIEFISAAQLVRDLTNIIQQLALISGQLQSRGTRSRTANVLLIGLPNSGKSSLFNTLLKKERSIVTSTAGTTRDAVVDTLTLGDMSVELVDTAGVEEMHANSARGLAQGVLQARLKKTDLALLCVDLSDPPPVEWLEAQLLRLLSSVPQFIIVGTKADLPHAAKTADRCDVCINPLHAESLDNLTAQLLGALRNAQQQLHSDAMHATTIRCRNSLELAGRALQRALVLVAQRLGDELVATELRGAIDDLSSIIGEVHTEDILGQIFSRFCIGK